MVRVHSAPRSSSAMIETSHDVDRSLPGTCRLDPGPFVASPPPHVTHRYRSRRQLCRCVLSSRPADRVSRPVRRRSIRTRCLTRAQLLDRQAYGSCSHLKLLSHPVSKTPEAAHPNSAAARSPNRDAIQLCPRFGFRPRPESISPDHESLPMLYLEFDQSE